MIFPTSGEIKREARSILKDSWKIVLVVSLINTMFSFVLKYIFYLVVVPPPTRLYLSEFLPIAEVLIKTIILSPFVLGVAQWFLSLARKEPLLFYTIFSFYKGFPSIGKSILLNLNILVRTYGWQILIAIGAVVIVWIASLVFRGILILIVYIVFLCVILCAILYPTARYFLAKWAVVAPNNQEYLKGFGIGGVGGKVILYSSYTTRDYTKEIIFFFVSFFFWAIPYVIKAIVTNNLRSSLGVNLEAFVRWDLYIEPIITNVLNTFFFAYFTTCSAVLANKMMANNPLFREQEDTTRPHWSTKTML